MNVETPQASKTFVRVARASKEATYPKESIKELYERSLTAKVQGNGVGYLVLKNTVYDRVAKEGLLLSSPLAEG